VLANLLKDPLTANFITKNMGKIPLSPKRRSKKTLHYLMYKNHSTVVWIARAVNPQKQV